jgi:nicotinate-nucleotide adenylyltransferase
MGRRSCTLGAPSSLSTVTKLSSREGVVRPDLPDVTLDSAPVLPGPRAPRRIGLFGGTFDPPHVGHLVTAVNVRHALDLDQVVLMVANVPWQKEGTRRITSAEDRFAMVSAAVADVSGLVAGRTEIDLGGPSYTADTLAALAREHPGAELFTIVGDDAAAGLTSWERYNEVVERSSLVVVDRPGDHLDLPDDVAWIRVEVPRLEVSSTDLRARFTDGRPLDYLVTEPVLEVIRERGCYDDHRRPDDSIGATRPGPSADPIAGGSRR